jgi:hypothetical protein
MILAAWLGGQWVPRSSRLSARTAKQWEMKRLGCPGEWLTLIPRSSAASSACCTQPDFRDDVNRDLTILTLLKKEGQYCLFLPKYHCEFNFIEMYWGACKRVLRKENSGKCPISLPVAACMCAVVILGRANINDF